MFEQNTIRQPIEIDECDDTEEITVPINVKHTHIIVGVGFGI